MSMSCSLESSDKIYFNQAVLLFQRTFKIFLEDLAKAIFTFPTESLAPFTKTGIILVTKQSLLTTPIADYHLLISLLIYIIIINLVFIFISFTHFILIIIFIFNILIIHIIFIYVYFQSLDCSDSQQILVIRI